MSKPIHPSFGSWSLGSVSLATLALSLAAVQAEYPATVLTDRPVAYYSFQDAATRSNIAANSGSVGAAGNATNFNVYPTLGAVAGTRQSAAYLGGSGNRSILPFNAAVNPPATSDFSVEAWIQPSVEVTDAPGPAPLMNRYSYSGANRQGWVFFQRSPATGWNFRTYTGQGSATGVNITGQSTQPDAGKAGTWNHLVAVWDAANKTATLYVNGEQVAEGQGDYLANTDDHDPAEAVRGAAGLCVGSYNNTEPGSNPFHGAVDEVAVYGTKLSAEKILAHYRNGTNAQRTTTYVATVLADAPVSYLRYEESSPDLDVALNHGSLGPNGNGANSAGVRHPVPGAAVGAVDTASAYQSRVGAGGVQTLIPWRAELNPEAGSPFTIEAWLQPHSEVTDAPGPAPLMNRYSYPGANRQGWVFFQRSPETGWNFRTYTGEGSSTGANITGQATNPGAGKAGTWNHLVAVWDGSTTTATLYVNGEKVAEGQGGYAANTDDHDPAEAVNGASGLAIGSYNNTQIGENQYNGAAAGVAFYNTMLSEERIQAHYAAGTNALRSQSYAVTVLADLPVAYLPLNDPAYRPVANLGTLGTTADASLAFSELGAAGPQPPALPGFAADNRGVALDGANGFVNISAPSGLNIAGQITLEAWIKPAVTQGTPAAIIAHGPTWDDTQGVSLRLVDGTTYAVGSFDGTAHEATAAIPTGDLDGNTWVHLAGTYDGSKWNLYRNGVLLASQADSVGALAFDADWAIGQRARGVGQPFAGSVDEVAIYSQALSADRLLAHYNAGKGGGAAPTIAIQRAGATVSVTFANGTLQASDLVGERYADVGGATSPFTPPAGATAKFYRVRQ